MGAAAPARAPPGAWALTPYLEAARLEIRIELRLGLGRRTRWRPSRSSHNKPPPGPASTAGQSALAAAAGGGAPSAHLHTGETHFGPAGEVKGRSTGPPAPWPAPEARQRPPRHGGARLPGHSGGGPPRVAEEKEKREQRQEAPPFHSEWTTCVFENPPCEMGKEPG